MLFRRISIVAAAALLFCTLAVSAAHAQSGAAVSDFSLQSAAAGTVKLSSYADRKAVVVIFVNPNCAFSRLYQSRLAALSSTYSAQGVQFLFVNAPINLEATAGAMEADKLKVKTTGNTPDLPYYTDESQQVAAQLGATKTPEAVLLQPSGTGFVVRYKGAIDDNPQMEAYVKEAHLARALDNVLAGRPVGVAERRAAGCLIKRM
jgi:thiol-disulfide isomerase/thioredoxin